ncbi:MAG TPA: hypothetical protein VHL52_05910 [Acidimicrobiia bacterium]|nr:hypothetical protein [Acidimicrobiia bacterium]
MDEPVDDLRVDQHDMPMRIDTFGPFIASQSGARNKAQRKSRSYRISSDTLHTGLLHFRTLPTT